ncbi:MAG: hypothetical protein CBB81_06490 [Cellvibrionales bacterium TMED21]|nr:hypothetical protein [Halieaceae bacterium]MAV74353.1 hypothetical protein [Halieaceae bacterium]OUT65172.1 MAG: hypothetical protein CBB81_07750 [Cellvibrionales bacterium TMED21]OUT65520.1 MAG: hypothetical protein CBB81_06490 [Cellvibrionales bacterium TMED21]
MNPEQLLSQLEPNRLPPEIGFWPLATGWWVLIAIVAAAGAVALVYALRRHRKNAYRRAGLSRLLELENNAGSAVELSETLKIVALNAFPQAQVAGLSGNKWRDFLVSSCPDLASDSLELLAQVHQKTPPAPSSSDWTHAKVWVTRHRGSDV